MTGNEFITAVIGAGATIGTVASAAYAKNALKQAAAAREAAEAALRFQVLVPALNEYRSASMYIAIRALWAFYDKDPATLTQRFLWNRERDLRNELTIQPDEFVGFIESTIDFHRRLVSQFYNLLTAVHAEGGGQRKWLYTYWSKRELKIIPLILIPLEHALADALKNRASPITIARLQNLCDDSPNVGGN